MMVWFSQLCAVVKSAKDHSQIDSCRGQIGKWLNQPPPNLAHLRSYIFTDCNLNLLGFQSIYLPAQVCIHACTNMTITLAKHKMFFRGMLLGFVCMDVIVLLRKAC